MKNRIPINRISRASSVQKSKLSTSVFSVSTTCSSIKESTIKPVQRTVKKSLQQKKTTSNSIKKPVIVLPRAQKKVFVLSEALQKQRQRQLTEIKRSIALLKYYNCMLMLFMMIYTSSQIIASNFFQVKSKGYPEVGVRLLDIILKVYETVRKIQMDNKLKRLAVNVLKIAPSNSQFQKKAEFISRKVTLNYQKRQEIQTAANNIQLQSFWEKIVKLVFISNQSDFLTELFSSDAQKLCLKDFQGLVDKYLCTDLFESDSKVYNQSIETFLNGHHHFTVEFLLIQKICTTQYTKKVTDEVRTSKQSEFVNKKTACDIY